jgi:outer membrane protein OmpA-like peptidoglycan-associated protein
MHTYHHNMKIIAAAGAFLILAACSSAQTRWDVADNARDKLTRLQSDPQLSSLAPVEINEAELAVRAAEKPRTNVELSEHLVYMADRKVDIARAVAQGRYYEDRRGMLSDQRASARLDSRTREADMARNDADSARADAKMSRMNELVAQQQNAELQSQITELNAKETDRGLVVTLGDVLFASGKSDLRGGATDNLDKLTAFFNQYPDRTAVIEGHTDNVGSENYNQDLSQRRADKVKAYLMNEGISSDRLSAYGKGETSPVAGNDSAIGRQQNRRVEVIISNTVASTN